MAQGNLHYVPTARVMREVSRHAQKRVCQRGIDQAGLPLVVAYGEKEFDGQGAIRYLMTSKALDALRRAVGNTKQVEALAGVYAVVSVEDQKVITAGHRYN